jgi:hypothetical protein
VRKAPCVLKRQRVDPLNDAAHGFIRRNAVSARHLGGDHARMKEANGNAARLEIMRKRNASGIHRRLRHAIAVIAA